MQYRMTKEDRNVVGSECNEHLYYHTAPYNIDYFYKEHINYTFYSCLMF